MTRSSCLLHRVLRRVPLARVDNVLKVLTLLIMNLQWTAVGRLKFHFQLAVGAVLFGVGGMVRDAVLVADVGPDLVEYLRQFALKTREVGAASGKAGEGPHLVIGLQVVHI